jgi:hypothetical protein
MSGRKTIISTGTKALQDQLYHRDLPLIGKAVGRPVTTALLKGRANYLCLQRLDSVAGHAAAGTQVDDLKAIREWRHRTTSGDRAELTEVAEDSAVRSGHSLRPPWTIASARSARPTRNAMWSRPVVPRRNPISSSLITICCLPIWQ